MSLTVEVLIMELLNNCEGFEGSFLGLNEILSGISLNVLKKTMNILSQDFQRYGQDSIRVPPDCRYKTLVIEQLVRSI